MDDKGQNKEVNNEENNKTLDYIDKYITYSKILDKRKGDLFSKEAFVKVLTPVLVYFLFWVFSLIPIFNISNFNTSPFQNVVFYLLGLSFFEIFSESIIVKILKSDEFDRLENKSIWVRLINGLKVAGVAIGSVWLLLETGYAIFILTGRYISPIINEKILSEYDAKKKYDRLIEEVKSDYDYLVESNQPNT